MTNTPLQKTPFYDRIVALKARMTEFGGWSMPIQYSGLIQEHQTVRQGVGLFDISHMAKFVVRGRHVMAQLDRLVPSDLSQLKPGKAQYTVLLNDRGGIIDDLIIYPQEFIGGEEVVTIIANAATAQKDKAWFLERLGENPSPGGGITFEDLSLSHGLLALQGPQSQARLQPLVDEDLTQIPRFGHQSVTLKAGHPRSQCWVARTGYTGEDGFEIMATEAVSLLLWDQLLAAGVQPCGLGARDTLRLEAALGLYGQDMDETTTPLEAGLGWLVHLDRKGEFWGRSALETQKTEGLPRRLVGLEMEGRNIARHDYPVLVEGEVVGKVTSGTWSPTLQKAIALAYVPPQFAQVGQPLGVQIRQQTPQGQVVKRPFYRGS